MAVFPESMDRLDLNDTTGSLRRIENYVHYMRERMEFAAKNINRSVGNTGTTTAEVLQILLNLTSAMSTMQSAMAGMRSEIAGLTEAISTIRTEQEEVAEQIEAINTRLTALEQGEEGTEG